MTIGFVIGAAVGIPLGYAMGLSGWARGWFDPIVEFMRPIPPLALIPLVIIWFGIGEEGKIVLLFLAASGSWRSRLDPGLLASRYPRFTLPIRWAHPNGRSCDT